jgi:5-methylcytosine-specific restriction endonuclease McrA
LTTPEGARAPKPPAIPHTDLSFRLPLNEGQIEAAKDTYRDNKSEEKTVCFSIGIQVGDNVELRDNLVPLLVELGVSVGTVGNAFCLSGREVWQIVAADPISQFRCLECDEPLPVRDWREARRMKRALDAVHNATPGSPDSADLFCDGCAEIIMHRLSEQARRDRLSSEARIWELNNKMSYSEYLSTREWKATKAAALSWAGYRCQLCNRNDQELHVHHRVYTRRGCERLEDLTVLCGPHHRQFHEVMHDAS